MENEQDFFIDIVKSLNKHGINMKGGFVCHNNNVRFRPAGYNLAYNLYRLGKLIGDVMDFD